MSGIGFELPRRMAYTLSILALIIGHMWVVVPLFGVSPLTTILVFAAVLGVCIRANLRCEQEERMAVWGFRRAAIRPGLRWALGLTLPVVAALLALGHELGTLRSRDQLALRFAGLVVWALAQQFLLQTVILREARQRFARRTALLVTAAVFALVHLPNPFLTPATFVTGLVWCWLYDRYPNLVPLALSHAAASLAALVALGPGITGGMRVGYGYFLANGIWF